MFDYADFTDSLPVLALLGVGIKWWFSKRKYRLPPGPWGLPVLGYLPFLTGEQHKDFLRLSKKYDKVFSLYLGRTLVVVLNDFQTVKEAFAQPFILDRPTSDSHFLPDGLGFADANGTEWVEQRRFTMRTLRDIGLGKNEWEDLVEAELNDFIKIIEDNAGRPVNILKPLSASVSNNVTSLVIGKRLPPGDPNRDIVDAGVNAVMNAFQQVGIVAFFPGLMEFIAKLGVSKYGTFRKKMVSFNRYFRNVVETRKQMLVDAGEDIFIDGYLKEIEKRKGDKTSIFNEKSLIGNSQSLVIGGSETVRTSLLWLLLAMANWPEIQEKVQKEIDAVLGKEGRANWFDRSKVPCTYAIILEGQRWRTALPVGVMHRASADTAVGGFDIPKGTNVTMNTWALHNDPAYWTHPEKFNPERFLTESGKLLPHKPESYVPFSYGRRVCPGEFVALIEIFHYFTALMQKFKVNSPSLGRKPNLEGTLGATYQPIPQKLVFTIRD